MGTRINQPNLNTSLNTSLNTGQTIAPQVTTQQTQMQQEEEKRRKAKQQAQAQSQAVQSSLPAMPSPQQQAQQGPSTQQIQASTIDPRFQQAVTQKFQQDVAAKQAALAQQQEQFQKQLQSVQVGKTGRIQELASKLGSDEGLSPTEEQEYQSLLNQQYQGPQGIQGAASAAALSQLAMSPALLAQQYAGGFGGLGAQDLSATMSLSQPSQALQQQQQQAMALSSQVLGAEESAKQQVEAKQSQIEAIKKLASQSIAGEEGKFQTDLSEAAKTAIRNKDEALQNLKEGLFLGGAIDRQKLAKLGLTDTQLTNLKGINLKQVSGFESIQNIKQLDKKVAELERNVIETGLELTPEQERLISAYKKIGDVQRGTDEAAGLAYATKDDRTINKINALRRLQGKAELTEAEKESMGKGATSGQIDQSTITGLIGSLASDYSDEYEGKKKTEHTLSEKQARLTGDRWYKGGITQAKQDIGSIDRTTYQGQKAGLEIAIKMLKQMEKNGATENKIYKYLKHSLGRARDSLESAQDNNSYVYTPPKTSDHVKDFLINLNNKINSAYKSYSSDVSANEAALKGMSGISSTLKFTN